MTGECYGNNNCVHFHNKSFYQTLESANQCYFNNEKDCMLLNENKNENEW